MVGKGDSVAGIARQLQIPRLIGPEKISRLDQSPISRVDVVEYLRFGGIPQAFIESDVDLGPRFLALISIEDSQRNVDTPAHGLVGKRIGERRIMRVPDAECRIGGAIGNGQLVGDLC